MKRTEILRLFKRNRGAAAAVARAANVGPNVVSEWLHGKKKSENVRRHATAHAQQLIAKRDQEAPAHV